MLSSHMATYTTCKARHFRYLSGAAAPNFPKNAATVYSWTTISKTAILKYNHGKTVLKQFPIVF